MHVYTLTILQVVLLSFVLGEQRLLYGQCGHALRGAMLLEDNLLARWAPWRLHPSLFCAARLPSCKAQQKLLPGT